MFCRNCATQLDDKAIACIKCGTDPKKGLEFCSNCGNPTDPKAIICVNCGVGFLAANKDCNKILAGLLAILLGSLGIHKFVMGYNKEGVIMLVIGILTCGAVSFIIGLIEGIVYLTKSDEDFVATYVTGKKGWF